MAMTNQPMEAAVPQLGLLGGFRLHPCDRSPSAAVQRLLGYLAVRRASVRRSAVRTDLWPESDAAHASASLRSALWRSPRPQGVPLVHAGPDRIALAPHVQVDLWHSTDHARHLATQESSQCAAYDHFVEDLLPDWNEDWLVVEQESYRQLRLHALERVSALLRERGAYPEALRAALIAVRGEPLRESAHREVIAAHLAEGNPAEALRQFHACRRLLAAELGLPPSEATRGLVSHLLGRPMDPR